jgi:Asp/Glu/hydantoin racemase
MGARAVVATVNDTVLPALAREGIVPRRLWDRTVALMARLPQAKGGCDPGDRLGAGPASRRGAAGAGLAPGGDPGGHWPGGGPRRAAPAAARRRRPARLPPEAPPVVWSRAGASGICFEKPIDRLGIGAEIRARGTVIPAGFTGEVVARDGDLTAAMTDCFAAFGHHAHRTGADGILATCPAFGPAIERMAGELPVPVLEPGEAMFRATLNHGSRIAMVATFAPAAGTMEAEFAEYTAETGSDARLTTILVEPAMAALRKGDAETHNRLIAERAGERAGFDAVMLAHFSTSRAEAALSARPAVPVVSAPRAAVRRRAPDARPSRPTGPRGRTARPWPTAGAPPPWPGPPALRILARDAVFHLPAVGKGPGGDGGDRGCGNPHRRREPRDLGRGTDQDRAHRGPARNRGPQSPITRPLIASSAPRCTIDCGATPLPVSATPRQNIAATPTR